jgi:hypothetical protein
MSTKKRNVDKKENTYDEDQGQKKTKKIKHTNEDAQGQKNKKEDDTNKNNELVQRLNVVLIIPTRTGYNNGSRIVIIIITVTVLAIIVI